MVGGIRDVMTCAEFQIEIFMGYNFTGGRIFDFCIDKCKKNWFYNKNVKKLSFYNNV